ncbi:hypothetical protein WJX81_008206 [Elliptochloris bilobata]|uniref:Glutaredoxin-like protein n=1 Tax=Elliptochloris bilobata TaxID=381761 RepID=A0AAW1S918_9CHLO
MAIQVTQLPPEVVAREGCIENACQHRGTSWGKKQAHPVLKAGEKIKALTARAQFMPSVLTDVHLEVRDITTDPEWERAYGLVIPVLTCAYADGSNEVKIPRQSPRMSTERLGAVLEQALANNTA